MPKYTKEYDYEEPEEGNRSDRRFEPRGGFSYEGGRLESTGSEQSPTIGGNGRRVTGVAFNYAPGEHVPSGRAKTPGLDYVESAGLKEQAWAEKDKQEIMLVILSGKPVILSGRTPSLVTNDGALIIDPSEQNIIAGAPVLVGADSKPISVRYVYPGLMLKDGKLFLPKDCEPLDGILVDTNSSIPQKYLGTFIGKDGKTVQGKKKPSTIEVVELLVDHHGKPLVVVDNKSSITFGQATGVVLGKSGKVDIAGNSPFSANLPNTMFVLDNEGEILLLTGQLPNTVTGSGGKTQISGKNAGDLDGASVLLGSDGRPLTAIGLCGENLGNVVPGVRVLNNKGKTDMTRVEYIGEMKGKNNEPLPLNKATSHLHSVTIAINREGNPLEVPSANRPVAVMVIGKDKRPLLLSGQYHNVLAVKDGKQTVVGKSCGQLEGATLLSDKNGKVIEVIGEQAESSVDLDGKPVLLIQYTDVLEGANVVLNKDGTVTINPEKYVGTILTLDGKRTSPSKSLGKIDKVIVTVGTNGEPIATFEKSPGNIVDRNEVALVGVHDFSRPVEPLSPKNDTINNQEFDKSDDKIQKSKQPPVLKSLDNKEAILFVDGSKTAVVVTGQIPSLTPHKDGKKTFPGKVIGLEGAVAALGKDGKLIPISGIQVKQVVTGNNQPIAVAEFSHVLKGIRLCPKGENSVPVDELYLGTLSGRGVQPGEIERVSLVVDENNKPLAITKTPSGTILLQNGTPIVSSQQYMLMIPNADDKGNMTNQVVLPQMTLLLSKDKELFLATGHSSQPVMGKDGKKVIPGKWSGEMNGATVVTGNGDKPITVNGQQVKQVIDNFGNKLITADYLHLIEVVKIIMKKDGKPVTMKEKVLGTIIGKNGTPVQDTKSPEEIEGVSIVLNDLGEPLEITELAPGVVVSKDGVPIVPVHSDLILTPQILPNAGNTVHLTSVVGKMPEYNLPEAMLLNPPNQNKLEALGKIDVGRQPLRVLQNVVIIIKKNGIPVILSGDLTCLSRNKDGQKIISGNWAGNLEGATVLEGINSQPVPVVGCPGNVITGANGVPSVTASFDSVIEMANIKIGNDGKPQIHNEKILGTLVNNDGVPLTPGQSTNNIEGIVVVISDNGQPLQVKEISPGVIVSSDSKPVISVTKSSSPNINLEKDFKSLLSEYQKASVVNVEPKNTYDPESKRSILEGISTVKTKSFGINSDGKPSVISHSIIEDKGLTIMDGIVVAINRNGTPVIISGQFPLSISDKDGSKFISVNVKGNLEGATILADKYGKPIKLTGQYAQNVIGDDGKPLIVADYSQLLEGAAVRVGTDKKPLVTMEKFIGSLIDNDGNVIVPGQSKEVGGAIVIISEDKTPLSVLETASGSVVDKDGKPIVSKATLLGSNVLFEQSGPVITSVKTTTVIVGPDGEPLSPEEMKAMGIVIGNDGKPIIDQKSIISTIKSTTVVMGPDGTQLSSEELQKKGIVIGSDGKPVVAGQSSAVLKGVVVVSSKDGTPVVVTGDFPSPVTGKGGKKTIPGKFSGNLDGATVVVDKESKPVAVTGLPWLFADRSTSSDGTTLITGDYANIIKGSKVVAGKDGKPSAVDENYVGSIVSEPGGVVSVTVLVGPSGKPLSVRQGSEGIIVSEGQIENLSETPWAKSVFMSSKLHSAGDDSDNGSSSDELSDYAEGRGELSDTLGPKIVKTTTKQTVVKNKDGLRQNIEEKVEDLKLGTVTVSTQENKVTSQK